MTTMNNVTLEKITTRIGDGLHGTPKYDDNGEYYFINGNNLSNGKIFIKPDTKKISSKEYEKIKKELNDRTILLAINGTIGNLGYYNGENVALGKSACYLNIKEDVDKIYIRYVLEHVDFQKYAISFATGATIKNLGLKAIRDYKFLLPPLPTQRKIASILSAYDDLIENNLKRINLLEELAQRTYEQWFVKFCINGKQLKLNKETGLPEGWEEKPINSIVDIISGYPFKSSEYISDGVYKIVTIKNVQDGFFVPITTDTLAEVPSKVKFEQKLETGDIILSLTGNVGRICLVYGENYLLNQRVAKIIPLNEANKCFVYSMLRSKTMITKLENLSNGAAQQNLSPINMGNMNICIPKDDVLRQFSKIMEGTIDLICKLNLNNALLKESRDILLPRLMSGVIGVRTK